MSASTNSIIKSFYIEDFQSHKETKIDLPGAGQLCVITGPTDSGKTAVVRALRLLMYNAPSGSDYIRVGRDRATVALEMADGTKVARERSRGSINRYRVTKPGESPTVLEGFGVSVPVEVREVTGVRIVSIGETLDLSLNLSEQLDGPFLGKSVSGPAKAKILGALAGTEEVDEAQRALGTDLHRAGQEEKRLADEVERLAKKIEEYDYLPGLAQRIDDLEVLLETAKAAQAKLCTLNATKTQLGNIVTQRIHALNILARWAGLLDATICADSAQGSLAMMQALGGHKASLARIAQEHQRWHPIARVRWAGLDAGDEAYNEAYLASLRQALLAGHAADLIATQTGISKTQVTLIKWAALHDATVAHASASDAAAWLRDLLPLRERFASIKAQRATAQAVEKRWEGLNDAAQIIPTVAVLDSRLQRLASLGDAALDVHGGQVVAEQQLSLHSKALCDAQSLYADTLISLGVCPICGAKVSPESISLHIEEVA